MPPRIRTMYRVWSGATVRQWILATVNSFPRTMTLPALALASIDLLLGLSCLLRPSFLAIGAIYTFNTLVIPIVLGVVAAAGFTVWNRRPYEKRIVLLSLAYVAIAFSLVGARILMTHIEPYRLKLQTVTIQTDKVSRPIRILHISDIQSAAVGRYEKKLNVSAGIGCEHTDGIPPIRFNCRPEMTLIELVPKPPAPPASALNKEKTR